MDVYKLFGYKTSSTDAAAQCDIQVDGHIIGMSLEVWIPQATGLGDQGEAEVSFASTSGFASNDTKSSIIHAVATQGFLTTGGAGPRAYSQVDGVALEVAAGERMYLHIAVVNSADVYAVAYLFVMPLSDANARALARRR